MPKTIYVQYLLEQPNSNPHYLNRLIKLLNHFISIEPTKKTKGYESHHIAPKSWKPEWKKVKDNLLKVPAKAHYVIHHLLWKAFPDSISMSRAFWFISGKNSKITAKTYEVLKSSLAFSDETRQKMSDAKKGKPAHNRGKPSPNRGKSLSEEQKKQISIRHKGKTVSIETRQKLSESQKGKPGHPHSEESKQKMRKPKTEETKLKISSSAKGRIKKPLSEEHKQKISQSMKSYFKGSSK